MAKHSRRSVLRNSSIALLGGTALAGCTGSGGGSTESGETDSGGNGGTVGSASSNTNDDEYTLSIGSIFARETRDTQMFIRFVDALEEKTDGRIGGQVLAQQVGGGEDHLNATASGTIDMHLQSVATIANAYGPEYGFIATPFIPQNWEHHETMYDEYILPMDEFNGQLVENGNQRALGTGKNGVRHVTANKPIRSPEDISGVKMRVPQITSWTEVWNAIGAQATPVAYDELYQSLQTGVVGASEGPISQVFDASLYEVQSHYSLTGHIPTDSTVTINEETWQSFSEEDKELVQTTLDESLQWLNEEVDSSTEDLMQEVQEEHGMTVIDDVNKEAFVDGATDALESMSEDWVISYEDAIAMSD